MKFSLRVIKHVLLFLCVQFPLQLVGAIALGAYLPIHRKLVDLGRGQIKGHTMQLPRILKWFDNADIYPETKRDYTTYAGVFQGKLWDHYVWLAWRNPINYFGYHYLGYKFTGKEEYDIALKGNLVPYFDVGDSSQHVPGLKIIELKINDKVVAYEYYYIKKWSDNTCFRFRLGHKISDKDNPIGTIAQSVFVISPYKSYRGL